MIKTLFLILLISVVTQAEKPTNHPGERPCADRGSTEALTPNQCQQYATVTDRNSFRTDNAAKARCYLEPPSCTPEMRRDQDDAVQ